MDSLVLNPIFDQCIEDYHQFDNVDHVISNPHQDGGIEHLLYAKCWIDTVQWHLEDIIRDPEIEPVAALAIKRRIDKSNQDRTDMVEYIDSFFLNKYEKVIVQQGATLNTESPAWAIDRLSILALKIYHMAQETKRSDVDAAHLSNVRQKLNVLLEQRNDLTSAIKQLIDDIGNGRKFMKVYKQMKMYNDPSLNPVLYQK